MFADEKLDRVEGNIKAAEGDIEVALHQDQTIDVPKQASQSLLGRIKDTIPFTGKKDENAKAGPNQAVADNKDAPGTAATPRGTSVALAETASAPGGVAVPEDPDVEKAKPAPKFNPYDHIQAAPGEGIMVPPDAPRAQKKGLLRTLFGVGGGSTESEHDVAQDDPKYRDISNR